PLLLDSDNDSIKPGMAIRDMERMLIEKTLKHHHGKRKETAAALGVSLKTLYNRLKEYEEAGEAIVV
ncbi:MAG: helix-turn-helix domain-containing protein, partial [Pseudomonadota bacterium]